MTTLTDTQVITASGGLVELGYNSRTGGISVDGTSWGSATIINPNTTVVCDGSPVVVEFSAGQVEISSGSSVQFALFRDDLAIAYNLAWYTNNGYSSEYQPVSFFFRDTPTAGSHTYSVRAIKPPGTFVYLYANIGSSQFDGGPATMRVSKIVQATQWPAVTTGTIICTSSTRPASPFEGQTIYETDTDLSLTWSGSAWLQTGSLGAWTTFVPTLTQSVTVTKTDSYCKWTRFGRTIHATAFVSATGFGMANNPVDLSLPVLAAAGAGTRIGVGHIYDASTSTRYTGVAEVRAGSNSVGFVGDWSGNTYWGQAPLTGIATSDQISYSVTYEAAS